MNLSESDSDVSSRFKTTGDRLQLFAAANLIQRFQQGCTVEEVHSKGVRCYKMLLLVLENSPQLLEIAMLSGLPAERVRSSAFCIVNSLMFNAKRNAFLSLGLDEKATSHEIKKRWKRLLFIFQSEKSYGPRAGEEMACKVNEAYGIIVAKRSILPDGGFRAGGRVISRKKRRSCRHLRTLYFMKSRGLRYIKYLPETLLVFMVFFALLSLAVFLSN